MNHAELESWADEAARGDRSAVARLYDALSGGLYGFVARLRRERGMGGGRR